MDLQPYAITSFACLKLNASDYPWRELSRRLAQFEPVPWLLGRASGGRKFEIDVLACPTCQGRMRLLARVTDSKSIRRHLAKVGEPTEPPARSPSRGPPFWRSVVLRQKMLEGANLGA